MRLNTDIFRVGDIINCSLDSLDNVPIEIDYIITSISLMNNDLYKSSMRLNCINNESSYDHSAMITFNYYLVKGKLLIDIVDPIDYIIINMKKDAGYRLYLNGNRLTYDKLIIEG